MGGSIPKQLICLMFRYLKMKKKKSDKTKSKGKANEPPKVVEQDPEKPFDFGGIPDRDLKKNLGCG